MTLFTRRRFLKTSVVSVASLSALSYTRAADAPNDKVVLAMIGIGSTVPGSVGGRGRQLIRPFSSFKDVDIAYLCDIDENFFPFGQKLLAAAQRREARLEKDLRRILEDKSVDAVVVATPDHWHALATIWACQASKHVYVEKPASHNLNEGRHMVEAARKVLDFDRVYAGIIAIGIAAFLFRFLLTFLEGILFPWRKASAALAGGGASVASATAHLKAAKHGT